MNANTVQSFPADTALTAHVIVKKTATGVAVAGATDKAIGTVLQDVGTAKPTADVALFNGYPTHYMTNGGAAVIAVGDEVELMAGGLVQKFASGTKLGVSLEAVSVTGAIFRVLVY